MVVTVAYQLLVVLAAAACAQRLFSARPLAEKLTAALVLVPLALRALLIR